jgi:hypothetical protein
VSPSPAFLHLTLLDVGIAEYVDLQCIWYHQPVVDAWTGQWLGRSNAPLG